MKNSVTKIVAVAIATLLFVSCGEYNKLLKSKDRELKYTKALEYYHKAKYSRTITLLTELAPLYTGTEREDTVLYYIGSAYFADGDHVASEEIFDDFRRRFGRSPFVEAAEYKYAMGFYYDSPDANRDQTLTIKAIAAIAEYMARYPQSIQRPLCEARIAELQQKLYEKSYINARTYYKTGRYKSAIIALRNALKEYPATPFREEILYLTVKSCYILADNSFVTLQRDRFMDVMDAYYTFVAEFPESRHIAEVNRMQDAAKKFIAKHTAD